MSTVRNKVNKENIDNVKEDEFVLDDFEFGRKLGAGSFSEVFEGRLKNELCAQHPLHAFGTHFAFKLKSEQFIGSILREKQALYECNNIPFTLQLYGTAKNDENIVFITELCNNGDLLQCLEENGAFSLNMVKYYGSCIIDALHKLHKKGIIHRDIKPENIFLNDLYEPILSDFGCVKLIGPIFKKESIKSDPDFVGTPQFMPPELIKIDKSILMNMSLQNGNNEENIKYFNDKDGRLKNEYYKCLDLWSFGCLLYQLRTAKLLFDGDNEFVIFKKVKTMNFTLDAIKDETFKDLLFKLLNEEPMKRIGSMNIDELKNHLFFKDVEWSNLRDPKRNEIFKKQIKKMIVELFSSGDIEEAIRCLSEIMDQPFYNDEVVKCIISSSFDHGNYERELTSKFLVRAVGDNNIDYYPIPRKICEFGFILLLQRIDDFYKDVPDILHLLSSFIARAIVDEVLPPIFIDKMDYTQNNEMKYAVINNVKYLLSGQRHKVDDKLSNVWNANNTKSIDSIKIRIKNIIKEYLISRELNEALICIQELNVAMFHHEIIKQLIVAVADYYDIYHDDDIKIKNDDDDKLNNFIQIQLAVDLISTAFNHNIMSVEQINAGFNRLKQRINDYKLDCPLIDKYYQCIVSQIHHLINN